MVIYYIFLKVKVKNHIKWIIIVIAVILNLLMAFSRFISGAHYINHLIMGIIMGIVHLLVFFYLYHSEWLDILFNNKEKKVVYLPYID